MNECPLSDEQIDAVMAEFFPRTKSSPGYRGFASAVAAAAVEAERKGRQAPNVNDIKELALKLAIAWERGRGCRIDHPQQAIDLTDDGWTMWIAVAETAILELAKPTIPEDRAALAEKCKQIAHRLFDISPEAEDMVHLSMAIDRLAASPPPSAAPEGWQLVPKKPTPLMLERMQDQAPASTMDLWNAWQGALAAAPKEPT